MDRVCNCDGPHRAMCPVIAPAAGYGAALDAADAKRETFAAAVRDGKRVRVVCGPGPDDATVIVYAEDGVAMSKSVDGWSAGVVEPICALGSDYLPGFFHNRETVEVIEGVT